MKQALQDDRLKYDAQLAEKLFGWSWFYDKQWDWAGMWPPSTDEWVRWNFPDGAQPIDGLGEHKLMPSWDVGGHHAGSPGKMGMPRFSSNWEAMSLLIGEMRQRGFWWHGTNYCVPERPAKATFATRTAEYSAQAETLPRATAMAALAAIDGAGGIVGEISGESLRGRLTSIRNVASTRTDDIYQQWLGDHNAGDTMEAALRFIVEMASAALEAL